MAVLQPTSTTQTTSKKSWLGVDPSKKYTAGAAKQALSGYLGRGWTDADTAYGSKLLGRTFQSDADELTGDEYNRLIQEGARLTGGEYTPFAATATPNPNRWNAGPAPEIERIGPYQGRAFEGIDPAQVHNDPAYKFRLQQGQQALENRASARGGTRGGNLMSELVTFGQGMASQEYDNAFRRAAQQHQMNEDQGRYAYESRVREAERGFAPKLLEWQQRNRQNELDFDREWQKEVYNRDYDWRRHTYDRDDAYRRFMAEENRRLRLAEMGMG